METAKVFWSGRSQAVRLPKSYRFGSSEVRIRRHANAVILEPIPTDWSWLDALKRKLDEDFVKATRVRLKQQKRAELDKFFK